MRKGIEKIKKLKIVLTILTLIISILTLFFYYKRANILHYTWKKDSKKMYSIHLESNQNTSSESFGLGGFGSKVEINTILNVRYLDKENDFHRIAFQFSSFELKIDGKDMGFLNNLYTQVFLSKWEENGNPISWIFPYTISKKDEESVLEILAPFIFILQKKEKWTQMEKDSLGKFLVKYNIKDNKILKSKIKYTEIYSESKEINQGNQKFKSIVDQSYYESEISNEFWINSGSCIEKLMVEDEEFSIELFKKGYLKEIDFRPDKNLKIWSDPFDFENIHKIYTEKEKNKISVWEELKKAEIKEEYKNENFESLYSKLFKDPSKFTNLAEMEKMREFLENFPEECLKIPDLLLKNKIRGNHVIEIIHLVASAGHKEAQLALTNIIVNENQNKHARMQGIVGFHEVSEPNQNSIDILWKIYEKRKIENDIEFSNAAVLALSAGAKKLENTIDSSGTNSSQKIKNRLIEELRENSSDPSRTSILLSAMGNTSDSKLFLQMKEFKNSDDKIVRSSLYSSVINFKDKESLDLLKNSISTETDSEGKKKIMQTLLHRKTDTTISNKILEEMQKENDSSTRNYMIQYLVKNKDHIPDLETKLKDFLETENDEANRELLFKSIYSNSK